MDKLKINLGEFKRGGGKVRCPNCNQETMNEPETSLVNAEDLMFLGPFVDFEDP